MSSGLGGMGGAQPLAATMNEATFLGFDVDLERMKKRVQTRYLDEIAPSIEAGIARAKFCRDNGLALSIGVVANAADGLESLIAANLIPDIVTDQTSAHDPVDGYVPRGLSLDDAADLRNQDVEEYSRRSEVTMADHVRAIVVALDSIHGPIIKFTNTSDLTLFKYGGNRTKLIYNTVQKY